MDPVMYRSKEGRREQQLVHYCKARGIFYQAYSSYRALAGSSKDYGEEDRKTSETLRASAAKHFGTKTVESSKFHRWKRSKLQVVLRWLTQMGVGALARSRDKSHIVQNLIGVFDWELDQEDVDAINRGAPLGSKTEL
jgi:diketogulonate reductase-like aldo/keto reductase